MVTSSTAPVVIVRAATLFLQAFHLNDHQYVPRYVQNSHYHYRNTSLSDRERFEPVEYDDSFASVAYFSKCCPPGFVYEAENRECVESKGAITPIYEELRLNTDLVKSNLFDCGVVADRYILKVNLVKLFGTGVFVVNTDVYRLGKYCIDNILGDYTSYVIRLCNDSNYCRDNGRNASKEWCVKKCCPDGTRMQDFACSFGATTPGSGLRVQDNRDYYEKIDGYALYHSGDLKCPVANWHELPDVNFTIRTNGTLIKRDDPREYTLDDYCVDTMYNTDRRRGSDILVLCEFSKASYVKWDFMRAFVIITIIFLATTIGIYATCEKPQRLIIIGFCTVNLIFWIMYCMRIFYVNFGDFCIIFGYFHYFFCISRLSWLNVLSCEIWLTVGNPTATIGKTERDLLKRKLAYVAYAILVPIVFTGIFLMGHRETHPLPTVIRPYIDPVHCAIDTQGSGGNHGYIYFYIPVAILTTTNLFLLIKTLWHFLTIRKNLKSMENATAQHKEKIAATNRRRGVIIAKLGLVMGVTAIYYIFLYVQKLTDHKVFQVIGNILLFTTMLEGVYLFVIFALKWRMVKQVLYRVRILKKDNPSNDNHSTSTESVDEVPMQTLN